MGHDSTMATPGGALPDPDQNVSSIATEPAQSSFPAPNGKVLDEQETREQPNRGKGDEDHGRAGGKRKKRDMGRAEWSRTRPDKRARIGEKSIDQGPEKVAKDLPSYATQFPADEIAADERRPKRKVAVLIGYSGSGYKGMQLTPSEKTIEGDLFAAFVAAGAISKANANDPKKSSLVRCARTDKGVHAAGNVVSLKLIVEDPDIVKKINENLSPQIRVWAIQRTNNAFSCYQMCDSRVYEYLLPTHCFLPPHPSSYLGKRLVQLAEETGDLEAHRERQEEVSAFWEEVDKQHVQPILDSLDATTRKVVEEAVYAPENSTSDEEGQMDKDASAESGEPQQASADPMASSETFLPSSITNATKSLRAAYLSSKRSFRLPTARLSRISHALSLYNGTHNYYNYTVQKTFRDPSAARVIKSFVCNPTPLIINGTEWLSFKVHGQSFMMHQIRKMVGMVAMAVRCGADVEKLIKESYGREKMSIPKAPGLGLLLERPVFETWSKKAEKELGREGIDFGKFDAEIEEFKQREIYERIFREEEKYNQFHNLFNHIDNWQDPAFLWVSSGGIEASKAAAKAKAHDVESGGKSGMQAHTAATAAAIAAGVESEGEDDVVAGAEEG